VEYMGALVCNQSGTPNTHVIFVSYVGVREEGHSGTATAAAAAWIQALLLSPNLIGGGGGCSDVIDGRTDQALITLVGNNSGGGSRIGRGGGTDSDIKESGQKRKMCQSGI
jgi:hypothetical protein